MSEVSNVGSTGGNGITGPKRKQTSKKKEPQVNAFDSYKKFKQEAEAKFKNFQDDANASYEKFRKTAIENYNNLLEETGADSDSANEDYAKALADPDNWHTYEAHEGEQPPIMNKPKTPPVYNPENEEGGQYLQAQIHEPPIMNKPKTAPVYQPEAADTPKPEQADVPKENKPEPVTPKPLGNKVSRQGVSGSYTISEGKNGNGFALQNDMQVRMLGEARKFFSPGFGEIKRDEDGYYNYRGIKSKNYNVITNRIQSASIEVSANNAIYNDLLSKKNSGKELTKAEQNFMDYHLKNLALHNLTVDKEGNLIDNSEK